MLYRHFLQANSTDKFLCITNDIATLISHKYYIIVSLIYKTNFNVITCCTCWRIVSKNIVFGQNFFFLDVHTHIYTKRAMSKKKWLFITKQLYINFLYLIIHLFYVITYDSLYVGLFIYHHYFGVYISYVKIYKKICNLPQQHKPTKVTLRTSEDVLRFENVFKMCLRKFILPETMLKVIILFNYIWPDIIIYNIVYSCVIYILNCLKI